MYGTETWQGIANGTSVELEVNNTHMLGVELALQRCYNMKKPLNFTNNPKIQSLTA